MIRNPWGMGWPPETSPLVWEPVGWYSRIWSAVCNLVWHLVTNEFLEKAYLVISEHFVFIPWASAWGGGRKILGSGCFLAGGGGDRDEQRARKSGHFFQHQNSRNLLYVLCIYLSGFHLSHFSLCNFLAKQHLKTLNFYPFLFYFKNNIVYSLAYWLYVFNRIDCFEQVTSFTIEVYNGNDGLH